jgi:POT family proton-dependent oligopeptide transporter
LFTASTIFWAVYEQAGSSLNLFAERYTDRLIQAINFEIPASWFQSFDSLFIVFGGAALFSSIWLALAKRNKDPSNPAKAALGLLIVGSAFLFMVNAADIVAKGNKVMPIWLIGTYTLHTIGELCLSPIVMSAFTKLAPPRFVGQIMGLFFLSISLGNLLAGLIAGMFDPDKIASMPGQYLNLVWFAVIPGAILLLLAKPLQKLAGGVR